MKFNDTFGCMNTGLTDKYGNEVKFGDKIKALPPNDKLQCNGNYRIDLSDWCEVKLIDGKVKVGYLSAESYHNRIIEIKQD